MPAIGESIDQAENLPTAAPGGGVLIFTCCPWPDTDASWIVRWEFGCDCVDKWNRVGHSGALWETSRDDGETKYMFLGEHSHSLDEKGRVVMPSKFRAGLDDGCVVTKGQERCLYVFPIDQWDAEAERVLKLPRTDRRARSYSRSFFASASNQSLDKTGRCQIPESLRIYAGLAKDVTVVGVADRVEIWDTRTWETVAAEADDYYADIEEVLSEDGI